MVRHSFSIAAPPFSPSSSSSLSRLQASSLQDASFLETLQDLRMLQGFNDASSYTFKIAAGDYACSRRLKIASRVSSSTRQGFNCKRRLDASTSRPQVALQGSARQGFNFKTSNRAFKMRVTPQLHHRKTRSTPQGFKASIRAFKRASRLQAASRVGASTLQLQGHKSCLRSRSINLNALKTVWDLGLVAAYKVGVSFSEKVSRKENNKTESDSREQETEVSLINNRHGILNIQRSVFGRGNVKSNGGLGGRGGPTPTHEGPKPCQATKSPVVLEESKKTF
ncbi:hypothetical protein R3P38DRAFT_3590045 [Favolaschia claudopus]|uniref:Uncharacterized protein n=1 Tax=Favolaschia claudopus TaxID=2862362 RepID=A0AAW0AJ17_9AGAR